MIYIKKIERTKKVHGFAHRRILELVPKVKRARILL